MSDNMGSGDMESVSERSWLRGISRPLEDGRADRASCTSALTSLGGTHEDTVAFRLPGFTTGDCRTRPEALAVRGAVLLLVLRSFLLCSGWVMAGSPSISMSVSMGECPVELTEFVDCDCRWPC